MLLLLLLLLMLLFLFLFLLLLSSLASCSGSGSGSCCSWCSCCSGCLCCFCRCCFFCAFGDPDVSPLCFFLALVAVGPRRSVVFAVCLCCVCFVWLSSFVLFWRLRGFAPLPPCCALLRWTQSRRRQPFVHSCLDTRHHDSFYGLFVSIREFSVKSQKLVP